MCALVRAGLIGLTLIIPSVAASAASFEGDWRITIETFAGHTACDQLFRQSREFSVKNGAISGGATGSVDANGRFSVYWIVGEQGTVSATGRLIEGSKARWGGNICGGTATVRRE